MARFIGSYEVVRELGAGHFGTVYLAAGEVPGRRGRPGTRRLVAIKRLNEAGDAASVDDLLQEFALLDQVKHRGIVRVFEYLEDENAVVMEHIHGVTLCSMLEHLNRAHEQVFTEAAIEIGCELADALYQAYTTPGDNGEPLRLVHRDLKPANVMLTPTGDVKILDWGLARVDNSDFRPDDKDRIKGTLMYMAPEQVNAREVDHRTDLFALGLMLYELLAGEPLYVPDKNAADPFNEVMARIREGKTQARCAEFEAMMPAVGPIVSRALQPRAADRFRDGHELLVELKRQLYRDRGAYLKEFCEFFFGSIHDIGDAPDLDKISTSGRAPRPGGQRLSIEDRLKRSMAHEAHASQRAVNTSSSSGGTPEAPSASSSGGPRPRATAADATPPSAGPPIGVSSTGASMATQSGGGGRRPPPVGGTASRATPGEGRKKLNVVGNRSPDETGMLEMVPLHAQGDESEASNDPSATQFFAIPAPKAERAKAAPAPPPPVAGASGVGGGMAPPPMGPSGGRPPFGQPPPAVMHGGPGIGMGGAGMGISGPVAGTGTPFNQGGHHGGHTGSVEAGQRIQSNRVYALIFAAFLMVCMAVVVALLLRPPGDKATDAVADASTATPVVNNTTTKKPDPEPEGDTAEEEKPKPKKETKPRNSSSSSSTTATKAPPREATGPGTLSVSLGGVSTANAIEVTCPGGFRQRGALSGGNGAIANVPQEACTLFFKGGAPAKYAPVFGGRTYKCVIVGTTADCK